jgi:hypothetical protein
LPSASCRQSPRGRSGDVDAHSEPDGLPARDPRPARERKAVRARPRRIPRSRLRRARPRTEAARRDSRQTLNRFRLAGVELRLEVAPDRLAVREHRVVADTPRRELHDPDVVVTLAVTACVGRSLIQGPKTVALPLSPHVLGTPIRRTARAKPAAEARACSLRRNATDSAGPSSTAAQSSGLAKKALRCPAARPGAPVAAGADEVAVRCE